MNSNYLTWPNVASSNQGHRFALKLEEDACALQPKPNRLNSFATLSLNQLGAKPDIINAQSQPRQASLLKLKPRVAQVNFAQLAASRDSLAAPRLSSSPALLVCLSVCLFVCLNICFLPIYLSIYLSILSPCIYHRYYVIHMHRLAGFLLQVQATRSPHLCSPHRNGSEFQACQGLGRHG